MLELNQISKSYGNAPVLCGVTLACRAGEAVCLAGANAAGKTTLLTIAAGLQKADSGEILCSEKCGYVPQETALLTGLSVRENLLLWYAAAQRPRAELFAPDAPETALGLRPFEKKRVSALSGGMKKRAAIACALVGKPACLLMDEPFAALDLQSRTDIGQLLCALKAQGKGLLFSSHDPAAIAAVADRVAMLKDGVIAGVHPLSGDLPARTARVIELLSKA